VAQRRALLACGGLALAGAIAAAPPATAAPANIKAGDPLAMNQDVFNPTSYSHDAGNLATLTWVAGGSHDADAVAGGPDGEPLFRTDLIDSGSIPVPGTQYLGLGSYPFICTIHAGMAATLNVNAGAPLPRPAVRVKLKTKSIDQALGSGEVKVKATITGGSGEEAVVSLKLGKRRIASPEEASRTKTLKLELSSKGKRALEKRAAAKLRVEARIDFGSPARATGKLR
jgi:plastocyanin